MAPPLQPRRALLLASLLAWPGRSRSAPAGERLPLERLRQGGLTLFVRTAQTDNSRTDDADLQRFDDCGRQRGLSPEGRQQAAALGLALRQAHCDVAEVVSSPLCRALATAELACGQAATPDPALAYLPYMHRARRALAREHLRDWLSRPVAAGRVRVVIADAANLMDLTGTYPAECAPQAFRATAPGSFEPVGSLPAPPWSAAPQTRSAAA